MITIPSRTYTAFDAGALLKPLCRVLEDDICKVVRPNNSIDASREVDEKTRRRQFFDSTLNDLAYFDVVDLKILLFDDRRLQRQLQETIKREISCHSSRVERANFPWS